MTNPTQDLEEARRQARFSNQSLLFQYIDAVTTNGNSYAEQSKIIKGDISNPVWIDAQGGLAATQAQVDQAERGDDSLSEYDAFGAYVGEINVSRYVAAYYGEPELLVTRLVNPPNMSEFVHAKPHQLSLLQPLLKFFFGRRGR